MERKRGEASDEVVDELSGGRSSKRPRLEDQHCQINPAYTSLGFQEKLNTSWKEKRPCDDESSGAHLLSQPFQCCILPNFISEPPGSANKNAELSKLGGAGYLTQLKEELLRLKFYEKNNDLYQFHQSDDLKKFKTPCIRALRSLFHDTCLPLLRSITGIELTDTIDMTCSKYDYTDVLLCHDDELEGRRIAFIFYLVPEWSREDGGALDLFEVDEHGQPGAVDKSLVPVWNNFVFFDVNAVSFHQVAEVMSSTKTRLSVNGWFHGPPSSRPEPYREPLLPLKAPVSLDLQVLFEWVNPTYLDIGVQADVQSQFEADSQVELPNFLLEEKYQLLCRELQNSAKCNWQVKGPPNKRHIHLAITASLSSMLQSFTELLQSEPFCRLLSHVTGLDLVHNIIRPDLSTECRVSEDEECRKKGVKLTKCIKQSTCATQQDHPSSSSRSEACSEQKLDQNGTNVLIGDDTETKGASSSNHKSVGPASECRCDLYRWQTGDYTLAADESDPGLGNYCLDAMLSFNCEGWSDEHGGMTSYIAKDEDEELLSISPFSNALSLVYRDAESLRFTKYINHRSSHLTDNDTSSGSSTTSECCFYTFTMLYKELEND